MLLGHGALTLGIKYARLNQYRSVSAFSPICSPMSCEWGMKALKGYLGESEHAKQQLWPLYDTCKLLNNDNFKNVIKEIPMLIDQGKSDQFLQSQLKTELLKKAVEENDFSNIKIRMHDGYDHSYYFIASFIEDHISFHSKYICS